jgi:hypothetical protein
VPGSTASLRGLAMTVGPYGWVETVGGAVEGSSAPAPQHVLLLHGDDSHASSGYQKRLFIQTEAHDSVRTNFRKVPRFLQAAVSTFFLQDKLMSYWHAVISFVPGTQQRNT